MIKNNQDRLSRSETELKPYDYDKQKNPAFADSHKSHSIAQQASVPKINTTDENFITQQFNLETPKKHIIYDFQSDEVHTQQSNNLNPQLNSNLQQKNISIQQNQPIQFQIPIKISGRAQLKQCAFCAELIQEDNLKKVFMCDHIYCKQCLKVYIQTQMKNNKIVTCPQPNCLHILDEQSEYYKKMDPVWQERYEIVKFRKSIEKNPNLTLCPDQNCKNGYIQILPNAKNGECKQCKVSYCLTCKIKNHSGKCQSFEQILLKDKFKYKRCFGCKRVVERNQGCPHMTCKCGTQFCYYCGGKWGSPHRCIRYLAGGQIITDKLQSNLKCMRPENFEYEYNVIGFILKLPYYFLTILILIIYSAWSLVILAAMTVGILVGTLFSGYIAMLCKLYRDGNTGDRMLFVILVFLMPLGFIIGWMISFGYMMYQTFPKYLQFALSAKLFPCFLC